ncbi:hypothetical protein HHS_07240 [Candidatus Pantoea carbekii]|uniref:DNA translocase FtsK n=1 Tax=Candidatus Pantoea carbekii TaxID=1235990 RepID=U3U8K7_9GAMM|nr:hypothetical protein HHS_07240 [Candidatus Pantoea carbekii]
MNQEYKKYRKKDRSFSWKPLSSSNRLLEVLCIIFVLCIIYMIVSLISFSPSNISCYKTSFNSQSICNLGGSFGVWLANVLLIIFGIIAYVVPLVLIELGWVLFKNRNRKGYIDYFSIGLRCIGIIVLIITSCSLATLIFNDILYFPSGGIIGNFISNAMVLRLNITGSLLALLFLWAAGITLYSGYSWLAIANKIYSLILNMLVCFSYRLYGKNIQKSKKYQKKQKKNNTFQNISFLKKKTNIFSNRSSLKFKSIKHTKRTCSLTSCFKVPIKTTPSACFKSNKHHALRKHSLNNNDDQFFILPSTIKTNFLFKMKKIKDIILINLNFKGFLKNILIKYVTNKFYIKKIKLLIRSQLIAYYIRRLSKNISKKNTKKKAKLKNILYSLSTVLQQSIRSQEMFYPRYPSYFKQMSLINLQPFSANTVLPYTILPMNNLARHSTNPTLFTYNKLVTFKNISPIEEINQLNPREKLSQTLLWLNKTNQSSEQVNTHNIFNKKISMNTIKSSISKSFPTLDLLTLPKSVEEPIDRFILKKTARLIEARLADYRIKAKVVSISVGPVITRFELDLAPGVKVARISNLSRDLARSLSTISLRIVEVIAGKPYVGLELPNKYRQTVYLREILNSTTFYKNPSPISIVLGKDIAGQPVVADLAKMPHLLVAGTTGSGKSVAINAMIISMLYKSTPEEVRFIMIDPKMLELSIYDGIPHLLTEVVTDMTEAVNVLCWIVSEMERRYKLMSVLGVRHLLNYNEKIKQSINVTNSISNPYYNKSSTSMDTQQPMHEKLPYIVVIIDEFADLMMVVGKKIEKFILRLSQKARAAGIHLVLATQRPSVDVITGSIKANIPTRIAFTVSSKIDSRTILDQGGAESLLGIGDMLYIPPNSSTPLRVHGAFICDQEVHAVVQDWKMRRSLKYIDGIHDNKDHKRLNLEL